MAKTEETKFGTCRRPDCGRRVAFVQQKLSDQQKAENAEILRQNDEIAEKNKVLPYSERTPALDLPHPREFTLKTRWTHWPEEPGQDNVYCPDLVKMEERTKRYGPEEGQKYYEPVGPTASPAEFCQKITNSGGHCNRPRQGEADDGLPLCGLHLKPVLEQRAEREARQEKNALDEWAKAEVDRMRTLLKEKYGLESEAVSRYGQIPAYDGKITVDSRRLLKLLGEHVEPIRETPAQKELRELKIDDDDD